MRKKVHFFNSLSPSTIIFNWLFLVISLLSHFLVGSKNLEAFSTFGLEIPS